jgi:hypothetical protein
MYTNPSSFIISACRPSLQLRLGGDLGMAPLGSHELDLILSSEARYGGSIGGPCEYIGDGGAFRGRIGGSSS